MVALWSIAFGAEQEVRRAAETLDAVGEVLLPVERDLVERALVAAAARLATVQRVASQASFAVGWPFDHDLWRLGQLEARGRAQKAQEAEGSRRDADGAGA
jgi:hypothetical protein